MAMITVIIKEVSHRTPSEEIRRWWTKKGNHFTQVGSA
jgi:hypothetical protein